MKRIKRIICNLMAIALVCMSGLIVTIEVSAEEGSYKFSVVAPTCTSEGYTLITYIEGDTTCEEKINIVDKLPHTYGEFKTITEATCQEAGLETAECKICGSVTERVIEPVGHRYVSEVIQDITCETDGIQTVKCTGCEEQTQTVMPALGHKYTSKITKRANCLEEGIRTYTCKVCEHQYTEEIPKSTIHSYSGTYVLVKESTCSEKGEKHLCCPVCNELLDTIYLSKLAHTTSWVTTKEPTEDETGLKENICSVCSEVVDTQTIAKLPCSHSSGENYTVIEVATCSTPQYVKITCGKCGEVLNSRVAQDIYDATNHSALSETITKEATETETGLKTISCEDCGYSVEEVIDILEECTHSRQSKREVDGVQWWYCKLCDANLRKADACIHVGYEKVERLDIAATETTKGKVSKLCSSCNTVLSTVDIPAHTAYTIDIGNGETAIVYGYFDRECSEEILGLLNIYRTENNLNTLTNAAFIQEEADLRAIESAYYFSHTRPNGTKWYTLNSNKMNGENLAAGYGTASAVMVGWKNSEGHNANLLRTSFNSVAISTFHQLVFYEGSYIPTERMVYAQEFSCHTS